MPGCPRCGPDTGTTSTGHCAACGALVEIPTLPDVAPAAWTPPAPPPAPSPPPPTLRGFCGGLCLHGAVVAGGGVAGVFAGVVAGLGPGGVLLSALSLSLGPFVVEAALGALWTAGTLVVYLPLLPILIPWLLLRFVFGLLRGRRLGEVVTDASAAPNPFEPPARLVWALPFVLGLGLGLAGRALAPAVEPGQAVALGLDPALRAAMVLAGAGGGVGAVVALLTAQGALVSTLDLLADSLGEA